MVKWIAMAQKMDLRWTLGWTTAEPMGSDSGVSRELRKETLLSSGHDLADEIQKVPEMVKWIAMAQKMDLSWTLGWMTTEPMGSDLGVSREHWKGTPSSLGHDLAE
jgi:hypothetical protein